MTDYKKDFPLLKDSQVAYLDNAATAQRPLAVLEAEKAFYEKYNANPLRGLYELGMEATDRYEEARDTAANFVLGVTAFSIASSVKLPSISHSKNLRAAPVCLATICQGRRLLWWESIPTRISSPAFRLFKP